MVANSRALTASYSRRSARREAARDALRTKIDGEAAIDGIIECVNMANAAYLAGDKDAVPAIATKLRAHETLLRKVLPDMRAVELTTTDEDGPVLILDFSGEQPYEPPPGVEVIDGEFVDVADQTADPSGQRTIDSLLE